MCFLHHILAQSRPGHWIPPMVGGKKPADQDSALWPHPSPSCSVSRCPCDAGPCPQCLWRCSVDGTRGSDQALDAAGHGDRVRGPHSVYCIAWALFVLPSPNPSLFLMCFLLKQNTLKALFFFYLPRMDSWMWNCCIKIYGAWNGSVVFIYIYIIFIHLFGWVFDAVGALL